MEYTIRKMKELEYPLLNDFLYEAIFIPDGITPPPRNIIASPELQIYVEGFGALRDDFALVAEIKGKIVGTVWVRIMDDYGHIDDTMPSLAISLYKECRGQGIGTDLMKAMLSLLKTHGYEGVSLSVQRANYAAEMYQKLGFEVVKKTKKSGLWYAICKIQKELNINEYDTLWGCVRGNGWGDLIFMKLRILLLF